MSRVIKFRAWDGKYMHTSFLVARPQYADVLSVMTDESFALSQYGKQEWNVMQFTGLTDKNGKDIYEGDILSGSMEVNGDEQITTGYKRGTTMNFSTKRPMDVMVEVLFDVQAAAFLCDCKNKNTYKTGFYKGCGATKAERDANYYRDVTTLIKVPITSLNIFEVIGNIHQTPELL